MVLDTRKTTPGLRMLEKYAVRAGGGTNKRMGLYDVAMIKDNHKLAAGGIGPAYRRVREVFPDVPVQVEVTTVAEAVEAVEAGADFLLCDNMSPELLAEVVAAVGDRAELEATGGLTLDRAAEYAASGVDYLSVGALTHSSPILDIALDLRPAGGAGEIQLSGTGNDECCSVSTSVTPTRSWRPSRARSWPTRGGSRPTPAPPLTNWG